MHQTTNRGTQKAGWYNAQKQHRESSIADIMGRSIRLAINAITVDKDFAALAEAKKNHDTKEIGRLLPLLRKRYGERDLSHMYRVL